MNNTIIDFVFDKKKLSDFGYVICNFEGIDIGAKPVNEIIFNTFKAPQSDKWLKISNSYESPLTTTIQICKNNCKNIHKDFYITNREISELSKWLCRKQYKPFLFLNEMYDDIYFEAQIKISKIKFGNNIIGLELVITTNEPYGRTSTYNIDIDTEVNREFSIIVDTDDEGILYPDIVTIKCLNDGDLSLINNNDNSNTMIRNCINNEVLTFDGKTLQITSNIENHKIYNDFEGYVFPHLCSKYDNYKNDFTCNMNAKIHIEYRGIRKVGL